MKRTNLVLDETLLKTATRLLGAKTYSEAVNRSLEEAIRIGKIRGLFNLMGQVEWEGELSEMRRDLPKRRPGKKQQ
ncbi:MAG: type II toxin-antitoxin system VapB family antitoxin [Deltaproteobacteria bacterium]|nr:type II toxin-antitoxin system VapB family antitoxin [Deltaproteobacteria bacterium]